MSLWQKPALGSQILYGHDLASGLVGCWVFNEGNGQYIYDLSGNGNTGTLTNMAPETDWVTSENGVALDFDGGNDVVYLNRDNSYEVPFKTNLQGTIYVMVKLKSLVNASKIMGYGGDNTAQINEGLFALEVRQDTNYYFSAIQRSDGAVSAVAIDRGSTQLSTDIWYAVVLTSDGSSWKLYVNANEDTLQTPGFGNRNNGEWFGDTSFTEPDDRMCFGALWLDGVLGNASNCVIDNVMIWDRPLLVNEVQSLYQCPYQMFHQKPIELWSAATQTAAAATTLPIFWHHYNKNIGA